MAKRSPTDPTTRYALDVVKGAIPASELYRAACQRHLDDLDHAKDRGWRFDPRMLEAAEQIFGLLKTWQGSRRGQPISLVDWERFVVGSLLGWLEWRDGAWLRRFGEAYIEVPKKNGKTGLGALIGVWGLGFDDEGGSEVFMAATTFPQAKKCFTEAKNLILKSSVKDRFRCLTHHVEHPKSLSVMRPVAADGRGLDGVNPHFAIADELHLHPSDQIYTILKESMSARRQPLMLGITTAGEDTNSFCGQQREWAASVLKDGVSAPSLFALIATIDRGDDWRKPKVWAKANPSLGTLKSEVAVQRSFERAQTQARFAAHFKRYHLNVWGYSDETWLPDDYLEGVMEPLPDDWFDDADQLGVGVDLAYRKDFASVAIAGRQGESIGARIYLFTPRTGLKGREEVDKLPYRSWAKAGFLNVIPGRVINFSHIASFINNLCARFSLNRVVVDSWKTSLIEPDLEAEGIALMPMKQNYEKFDPICKTFEFLLSESLVTVDENPLAERHLRYAKILSNPNGWIRPYRKSSDTNRIDGLVALLMAMTQVTRVNDEDEMGGQEALERLGLR